MARDLALVLAAATAACGAGGEKAIAGHTSAADAAQRAGTLRAVFAGLTHELELRAYSTKLSPQDLLTSQDPYEQYDISANTNTNNPSIRFIVDELDEAQASLSRVAAHRANSQTNKTVSCFAGAGGIIHRTIRASNAIGLPFDELVDLFHEKSVTELTGCGLSAFSLDTQSEGAWKVVEEAAKRASACRMEGASNVTGDSLSARLSDVQTRVTASDLALRDVLHAESRGFDVTLESALNLSDTVTKFKSCLGDLAQPLDPNWNANGNAKLATSTSVFTFLVAAALDIVSSSEACSRSLDAPPGTFFSSPVIDIVAQEAVESGALNALLQWLHMTQQNAGSAGFESSIDEVAIAAKACTVDRSRNWTSPWIKVDRTLLDSTLSFLSKLEGVFLGHRVGRYGYSATGKLVKAISKFKVELEEGGCVSEVSSVDATGSVTPSTTSSSTSRASHMGMVNTTGARVGEISYSDIEIIADDGSSSDSKSRPSSILVGFVGGAGVFCLVACVGLTLASRKNKRVTFSTRRSTRCATNANDNSDNDTDRDSNDVSDRGGLLAGGAAGSARRFYRHLEAGSAADLPLVEDLDLVPSLPGARSPSGRLSPGASFESPSPRPTENQNPYASLFFAPTNTRRRSHSISEPVAGRAALPPRHERRHTHASSPKSDEA